MCDRKKPTGKALLRFSRTKEGKEAAAAAADANQAGAPKSDKVEELKAMEQKLTQIDMKLLIKIDQLITGLL